MHIFITVILYLKEKLIDGKIIKRMKVKIIIFVFIMFLDDMIVLYHSLGNIWSTKKELLFILIINNLQYASEVVMFNI